MQKKKLLPVNLQLFADEDPEAKPETEEKNPEKKPDEPEKKPDEEPPVSIEEQLAKALATQKMLEKKLDKTKQSNDELQRKYNEILTQDQKAKLEEAERKAEEAEELQRLRKENTVTKYEKNFLGLGYPDDLASEAAEAQYENDTETLFRIQNQFLTIRDKQKEAEWQKNRPLPKSGGDEDGVSITLEQLSRMPYLKQVEFKQQHPEAYKKIMGGNK